MYHGTCAILRLHMNLSQIKSRYFIINYWGPFINIGGKHTAIWEREEKRASLLFCFAKSHMLN